MNETAVAAGKECAVDGIEEQIPAQRAPYMAPAHPPPHTRAGSGFCCRRCECDTVMAECGEVPMRWPMGTYGVW